MTDHCTDYGTPVENDFYTELFATDHGAAVATPVQNAKTDLIVDDDYIEFEQWMYYLVERFAADNELDAEMVSEALSDKFINDLKAEFDDLKEIITGDDDEDDDDDEE
jgi:hypothetical protein